MSINFAQLRELKAKGLSLGTILVKLYLAETGPQPIGRIVEATGLSERSVYAALAALKKTAQDLDLHGFHGEEGTVQAAAAPPQEVAGDSLQVELVELGIFPGAAARLIEKSGREAVQQQVSYHRYRLANGFKFKKAPAAMLYRACEDPTRFPAPEGFHRARAAHAGVVQVERVVHGTPAVVSAEDALQDERIAVKVGELRTELQLALSRPRSAFTEAVIRAVHRKAAEAGIPMDLIMPPSAAS